MSLIARFSLNNNLNNSGAKTFTFSNTPTFTSDGKVTKYCGQCTSTSYGTRCNSAETIPLSNTDPISMFTWVCMNSYETTGSYLNGLVSNHKYSDNSEHGSGFGLTLRNNSAYGDNSFQVSLSTAHSNGRTYNRYYGKTKFYINEWHHVGFTYDGSKIKLYLDGNEETIIDNGTDTNKKYLNFTSSYSSNNPIGLFCWSIGYNDYTGNYKLNDVRIYNHALSKEEVKEIAQGLAVHYAFNFEDLYQPIEYLESTGTQYIDTGIKDSNNTCIEVKYILNTNHSVYGTTTGLNYTASNDYKGGYFYYSPHNDAGNPIVDRVTTPQIIIQDNNKCYRNSILVHEYAANTFTNNLSMFLFGRQKEDGTLGDSGNVKLYYCKIWDNKKLVRDFIPVVRKTDAKPGLFDLVKNKFYINAGAGEFHYSATLTSNNCDVGSSSAVSNGTISTTKSNGWDTGGCVTKKPISGDCYIECFLNQTTSHVMVGLSDGYWSHSPGDSGKFGYQKIHAIYALPGGGLEIYDYSADRTASIGTYNTGDKLSVKRIRYTCYFMKNDEVVYTSVKTDGSDLYGAITFYDSGSVSDARFSPIINSMYDNSGNKNDGTFKNIGITTTDETPVGNLAAIFPSTGVITPILPTVDQYTISCWFKLGASNTMPFGSNSLTENNTRFYCFGDNSWRYETSAGGQEYYYPHTAGTVTTSKYIHWVATYDGKKTSIYRNGILEGSQNVITSGATVTFPWISVGYGYNDTPYWSIQNIADFRLYTTALSQEDILDLYKANTKISNNYTLFSSEFNNINDGNTIRPNISVNGGGQITKFSDTYYKFNKTGTGDATRWQGILINSSYFAIGELYKISFLVKGINNDINFIRGHSDNFNTIAVYINGQKTACKSWKNGNTSQTSNIAPTDLTQSLDTLVNKGWTLYDVYVKYTGEGSSTKNFYIQPNRGYISDTSCESFFANITITHLQKTEEELFNNIEFLNKNKITKADNIIEYTYSPEISNYKKQVYISKNGTIQLANIKEN